MIGSRDGLFYINEATGIVKSFVKPVLTSDLILTICFYEGEYYIGTYGGGMMVLNPQTLSLKYFTQGDTELFQKGHIFCVKPDNREIFGLAPRRDYSVTTGRQSKSKTSPAPTLSCPKEMCMK